LKKDCDGTYESIGWNVGELVSAKQRAYGDSFGRSGECLRQMFPNGIKPEQYDDLLTIARILDKNYLELPTTRMPSMKTPTRTLLVMGC
jgi:hypothetical protein